MHINYYFWIQISNGVKMNSWAYKYMCIASDSKRTLAQALPNNPISTIEIIPWAFHWNRASSSTSVCELELQGFTSLLILIISWKQEEATPSEIASRSSFKVITRRWIFISFPSSILTHFLKKILIFGCLKSYQYRHWYRVGLRLNQSNSVWTPQFSTPCFSL